MLLWNGFSCCLPFLCGRSDDDATYKAAQSEQNRSHPGRTRQRGGREPVKEKPRRNKGKYNQAKIVSPQATGLERVGDTVPSGKGCLSSAVRGEAEPSYLTRLRRTDWFRRENLNPSILKSEFSKLLSRGSELEVCAISY